MKAHDVRELRVCLHCHDLLDKRDSLQTHAGWWHARCYAEKFGKEKFLALPWEIVSRVRLSDIGPKLMRAMLDRRASETGSGGQS